MAGGVAAVVVIESVELTVPFAAGVTDTGAALQPTAALLVVQLNPTVKLKPFNDVIMMFEVAETPGETVADEDESDIV